MSKLVIKTPAGYVKGFNAQHQVVQVTQDPDAAKTFTRVSATNFMDTYADAGYGLTSGQAQVEIV